MTDATAIHPIPLSGPTNAGGVALRWSAGAGKLYWLEPEAERLLAWQEKKDASAMDDGSGAAQLKLPQHLSTLAVCASGQLLVGMEKRLCLAPAPGLAAAPRRPGLANRILVTVDAVDPRTVIGEGRTDRSGNFVFGTRNIGQDRRPIGSFYQYSTPHGLRRLALPTVTWAANVCFSRDGRTMYFGDATSNLLRQCRYDAGTARTAEVRGFASAPHGATIVDAIVDGEDCVWAVQRAAGFGDVVIRYGPDGSVRSKIALPAGQACSLAFGGASLDRLFMVGAAGALVEMPHRLARGLVDTGFDDSSFDASDSRLPPNPAPPGHA